MQQLVMVLVEEPGRDTRALPGFFYNAEDAVAEHVSFTDHPGATRFLVVGVIGQVSASAVKARSGLRAVAAAYPVPAGVHPELARVLLADVLGQQQQRGPHRGALAARLVAVGVPNRLTGESGTIYSRPSVLSFHAPLPA